LTGLIGQAREAEALDRYRILKEGLAALSSLVLAGA
jgi:hypothetical protein